MFLFGHLDFDNQTTVDHSNTKRFLVFGSPLFCSKLFIYIIFFLNFQQAWDSILKEREAAEKQIRAREAREKQERERLDRAAKKRALVDFNAPDDQEGVMDSLLEALKTGSAFNREQKRKRAPRAAGGITLRAGVGLLFSGLGPYFFTNIRFNYLDSSQTAGFFG